MRFRGRRLSFMRDKSLEAKQKRAVTSQQTYIHAVRSSRSYVPACGAVHAAPPVGHRPLRPVLPHPSARRAALSAPYYPIRVSNGVLCALLLHPPVERHHLRPVAPSARRTAPSAPCYPIRSASSRLTAVYFFSGMGSSLPSCRVTLQRVTSRTKAGLTR